MQNINTHILRASKELLNTIQMFRSKTDCLITFSLKISALTKAYKSLIYFITLNNVEFNEIIPRFTLTIAEGEIEVYNYINRNKEDFIKVEITRHISHGILKIETYNQFLNPICMKLVLKKRNEEQIKYLEEFLSLYYDHKNRVCEICMKYLNNGEIPIVRKKELNYISAFHVSCYKKK